LPNHRLHVTARLRPFSAIDLADLAALALACFVAAWLHPLPAEAGPLALGAPIGLTLAALILGSWPLAVGAALGTGLAAWTAGVSPLVSIGLAATATGSALAGAWVLGRVGDFSRTLSRPRHVLTLIGLGAFLLPVVPATAILALQPPADGVQALARWWLGWVDGALGVTLLTPLLLTWLTPRGADARSLRTPASVGLAALQVLVHVYVFAFQTGPLAFLCLPPALLSALYLGLRWICAANLLTAGIALGATLLGYGPFAGANGLVYTHTFGLLIAITTLVAGSLAAERRRADAELQETAERFEQLAALSSDWYWEQDENLRFTMIAGRALEQQRFDPRGVIGRTRWEIDTTGVSPEERERHDQAVTARLPFRDVLMTRHNMGPQPRLVSVSGEPIFDRGGRFRGYRGVARDITLKRQAEREIAQNKRYLDALINALPTPILVKDAEHRFIACNAAFCRLFRRDAGDILGKTDYDFFGAEQAGFFWRTDDQALAGGEPVEYEQPYTLDGHTRWMLVRKTGLTRPDDSRAVVLVLVDVTERREAEAALRDSEQRFRSLTALSADWYWEQDAQLRFTFFAAGMDGKTAAPEGEMLGRTRFELDLAWESDAAREAHRQTLAEHRAFRDLLVQDRPTGRWVMVSGEPVFDASGQFAGYRGTAHDVTRQKQAEARVARLKDMYAAMTAANDAIIHCTSTTELFEAICRIVVEHGHVVFARVAKIDYATGWLNTVARAGDDKGLASSFVVSIDAGRPEGEGPSANAIRAGTNYVCNDIATDHRNRRWRPLLAELGIRAQATFILRRQGKVVGSLHLYASQIGYFDEELVRLLEDLAANLSFALDNFQREEARLAAEAALRESEKRFRDFADAAGEYVWEADPQGRFTYVSSRVQSVWGNSDQELIGHMPSEFMPRGEPERVNEWLQQHMQPDGGFRDLEHCILTKQGETRWLLVNSVGMRDEQGHLIGHRGTGRDITDRKSAEARISYLATRDPLTELPNRLLFNDRLEQGIVAARRSGQSLALMFIDLDRFKNINDSLGHQVGDMLLKEVAVRMQACIRKGDTLSRLGGDEFVVTLEGLQQAEDAIQVASKIIKALARPFEIGGHTLNTSCSIGISIFPDDAEDDRTLMKNADTAMYHAKEKGRNNYQFFSPEMNVRAVERHNLETALRLALERQEFSLHFQPQVDIRTSKVVGVEALLRWHHPERGLLSPATFMAVAEESGLIEPIGQWVLRSACQRAKAWQDAGYPPLKMAVNISARQLNRPRDFARGLSRILSATGLDPRYLELEMTESLLLQNADENIAVLRKLGQDGVRIAVDDFGTGYSSLAYLRQLPIDTLKIDRSFVRDLETDPEDAVIIHAVVAMAHSLDLLVTAEGVETRGQLEALAHIGCDEYQGYLFSRPLPATELAARFLAPGELPFERAS
jgi:diguanylate cyclase (GGDEF)-like protein/PAS domain S-box-containing protein